MIHFVVLLRTSQALQFQTAFLLIHSIVHAIVDDTFSFLTDVYYKYLGFMELAKYGEWGKFAASVGHPKATRFSASGGRASAPDQCLCPWTPLGAPVPDSRYRLEPRARHVRPPHIFLTWRRP